MKILGVFFTRGVSLRQWVETGLFDREVLIYRNYLDRGQFKSIKWFTYGASDSEFAEELYEQGRLPKEIRVISMPTWILRLARFGNMVYLFLMPFVAHDSLRTCTLYKTNQMDGALAAVIASKLYRKPLYVRTGYTLSMFIDRIHPHNLFRRAYAWLTEKIALSFSDASSVSSAHDRDYLISRYGLSRAPVVIGNYVDIERFTPVRGTPKKNRIIFVGRLIGQKNLAAGIIACASAGIGLDVVGNGPDREELQALAIAHNADTRWLGTVSNDNLPVLMSSYRYFFLPSLWEGMPKALLEAMALGLVCVGNNASGINEVIRDGVTGFLSSGPDTVSLRHALSRALSSDAAAVAAAGRVFVCENFSLESVVARELKILDALFEGVHKRENP